MFKHNDIDKRFLDMLSQRKSAIHILDEVKYKIITLNEFHKKLLSKNNKQHYNFVLDTLFFKIDVIKKDYYQLNRKLKSFDNRMYYDYSTLYNSVKEYTFKNVGDKSVSNHILFSYNFKPYKHLDKKVVYSINSSINIKHCIVQCLQILKCYLECKSNKNKNNEKDKLLNINNLVHSEMFASEILQSKLDLFYNYLRSFSNDYYDYYTRLILNIKLLLGIANHDLEIKDSIEVSRENNEANKEKEIEMIEIENKIIEIKTPSTDIDTIRNVISNNFINAETKLVLDNILNKVSSMQTNTSNKNIVLEIKEMSNQNEEQDEERDTTNNDDVVIEIISNEPHNEDDINIDNHVNDNHVNDNDVNDNDVNSKDEISEKIEVLSNASSDSLDTLKHKHNFSVSSIGRRVYVDGYSSPGTLLFYGNHNIDNSKRCGVELDKPIGKNNGTIKNHKYFTCKEKHGVLVAPWKITFLDDIPMK